MGGNLLQINNNKKNPNLDKQRNIKVQVGYRIPKRLEPNKKAYENMP